MPLAAELSGARLGLVHVKTGGGPGKTTSAFGLALRASGRGMRVLIAQFMKKGGYGEVEAIKHVPRVEVRQFGRKRFVGRERLGGVDVELARQGLEEARLAVMSGGYDLVVLDEVNVALSYGLLKLDEVVELVKSKPSHVELVLTGRGAPKELYELADYVTEFVEVKHPWRRGVVGRPGIEY
ncbi:MAG: cob(I)yrinic acid a,c-diamide adenosyltransferase [Thermoprotei archaeon]|nr:MAG: cob(I)yrinic acid a,c-diamide adenosyltransferase [Thermoprotei archaeon]RLF14687.1 MAG: cob(I)yrinic acid a,c-diamide adenosyltransferase [Thermoprotei archaeon]